MKKTKTKTKEVKTKKAKSNIPTECLGCGSKNLVYVENVYVGVDWENDEKPIFDDALRCLDCKNDNLLDSSGRVSTYSVNENYEMKQLLVKKT